MAQDELRDTLSLAVAGDDRLRLGCGGVLAIVRLPLARLLRRPDLFQCCPTIGFHNAIHAAIGFSANSCATIAESR